MRMQLGFYIIFLQQTQYFIEAMSYCQSCITCGRPVGNVFPSVSVDCDVENVTDTLFVIFCDTPFECQPEENCSGHDYICSFSLYWFNKAMSWTYTPFHSPRSPPPSIPTGYQYNVSSVNQITSQPFSHYCYSPNCNELANLTVSVTVNTQTSTTSTSSTTPIVSMYFSHNVSSMIMQTIPVGAESNLPLTIFASIAGLVLAVLVVLTFIIVIYLQYRKYVPHNTTQQESSPSFLITPQNCMTDEVEHIDEDFPFAIISAIGKGKFGSVYTANYANNVVAVKIFVQSQRKSWNREKNAYLQSKMHENILDCFYFGQKDDGMCKNHFRICEYHPFGSLNHFLQRHALTWPQVLNISLSIASGLAHLHSNSYVSKEGHVEQKSAIAHRDIKSANVLVKDISGHCVIGDLGLALILDQNIDDNILSSSQVGTYRYMAPEALDARVNLQDIESFKQIDVYALALVIWEVCARCDLGNNLVSPYQSPYSDIVGERPTLELMKHTVVIQKSRPHIMGYWSSHPGLKVAITIMEESWDEDPEARLTAANIVSRLEMCERSHRKEDPTTESEALEKKVRVSSSFSGQSRCVASAQRRSVGSTESPHNIFVQPCFKRGSLPHHFELNNCIMQSDSNVPNFNESTTLNIDAATGQPNTLNETVSPSTTSDSS